jgi:hypothetical protein
MWYSAKLAFIGRPDRESTTAPSCSANDTPQIIPPQSWLCTKRGLMIRPAAKATGAVLAKEISPLGRQHDAARFTAFRFVDGDGVGVRIEILHFQLRTTGFERRPY